MSKTQDDSGDNQEIEEIDELITVILPTINNGN